MQLREYVPEQIWLADYPIRYGGARFEARMTVVRLADDRLWVHSPGPMAPEVREQLSALGEVGCIVAPGNFHHFHVAACQRAFPEARTWICPGVERKQPELQYDGILDDEPPEQWAEDFSQALTQGSFLMREVAFLHEASRTLILVDLIENFGDETPNINWVLVVYWKILRMWNRPKPAPEYQMSWTDRKAARAVLERILEWDFDRIVIAHGDLIEQDAKEVARKAWRSVLRAR